MRGISAGAAGRGDRSSRRAGLHDGEAEAPVTASDCPTRAATKSPSPLRRSCSARRSRHQRHGPPLVSILPFVTDLETAVAAVAIPTADQCRGDPSSETRTFRCWAPASSAHRRHVRPRVVQRGPLVSRHRRCCDLSCLRADADFRISLVATSRAQCRSRHRSFGAIGIRPTDRSWIHCTDSNAAPISSRSRPCLRWPVPLGWRCSSRRVVRSLDGRRVTMLPALATVPFGEHNRFSFVVATIAVPTALRFGRSPDQRTVA